MIELHRWRALLAEGRTEGNDQPQRICQLCVTLLNVSGAGISMITAEGNRGVVCATDDRAGRIEDLQLTTGRGPCVAAVHSGAPVLIADVDDTGGVDLNAWDGFGDGVRNAGVRAVFAFPLRIGAITLGALDLYRDTPGELSVAELSAALLAADAAALALLHIDTTGEDAFAPDDDSGANYRLVIHQATGMVAVQLGVSLQEALLRLRARAFADARSLAELADDVVARRIRFTPEDT